MSSISMGRSVICATTGISEPRGEAGCEVDFCRFRASLRLIPAEADRAQVSRGDAAHRPGLEKRAEAFTARRAAPEAPGRARSGAAGRAPGPAERAEIPWPGPDGGGGGGGEPDQPLGFGLRGAGAGDPGDGDRDSAPEAARASRPSRATGSETAPWAARSAGGTPSIAVLAGQE